jgi:predicted ATPase with chaperone activity
MAAVVRTGELRQPMAISHDARPVDRGGMSARAVHRALRVARTIADLAGE